MKLRTFRRLSKRAELEEWAKDHDAQPAEKELVDGSSMLTFNVDGKRDGNPISWDAFYRRFSENNMNMLVEPSTSTSHYFKLTQEDPDKDALEMGNARADATGEQAQMADTRAE